MTFDDRDAAARGLKSADERVTRGSAVRSAAAQEPFRAPLLLVRIPPAPLARATTTLPPEPASVSAARRFVCAVVAAWGYPDLAERTKVPVSELMTNAVRHARRPVDLRVHRTRREVIVEISDDDPHAPQPRMADPEDENGRGLMLVDSMTDAWGTRLTGSGKTIWFSLAVHA